MNFELSLSTNNTSYTDIDLFPNQTLQYDAEFYDDKDVSSVKIPFITEVKIPLTSSNKSFFGYDPVSSNASSFPDSDYYYKIKVENQASTILYGVCKVQDIEYNSDGPYINVQLKDFLSRFLSNLKDLKLGDVLTSSHHTSRHTISDFNDTTANGGEAGVIGQNPDYTRIVNFPFVDLANDTAKFGYESRQFVEYGSGQSRNGLIPTLSVSQYLKQIGSYLSTGQVPVKVKSKLFGINETEAIPDFQAEKLQAVIPAKILAKQNVNNRTFLITHRPDASSINENLDTEYLIDGSTKLVSTNYYNSYEVFGNYGTTGTSYQKYGVKAQSSNNPTSTTTTGEFGYFAPHMSFNGRLEFRTNNRDETTGTIKLDLPMLGEDRMVQTINPSASTMVFNVYLNIYQDGYLQKKIALLDTNGDVLELLASDATTSKGGSQKQGSTMTDYKYAGTSASFVFFPLNQPVNIDDQLEWPSQTVRLPSDEQLDMEFFGESRYATSITVEPVSGELNAEFADALTIFGQGPNFYVSSTDTRNFFPFEIRKAITRVQNYSNLDLRATAVESSNPYFPDDEFIIKDSINDTCELGPVDFIKMVCKRFGCGLFYEFDGSFHVLRIDPLHILRTTNQDGDYLIDDLKSIKVLRPLDPIKNLIVKNKSTGLFFDEISEDVVRGDINQVINVDGISDFEISLKSAVYFKSLCGEVFLDIESDNLKNGIVSTSEYGVTDNIMSKYDEIGVRFAFLDKPLYGTNLKVPFVIEETIRPNIYTTTQRIYRNMYSHPSLDDLGTHVFNGRLSHKNTAGWNLLGEEDGSTTEYYDLISDSEQVKSQTNLSVELSIVVPTNQVGSVMFMLKKTSFSLLNSQNVLIKSASGQVYEENTYLNVKGIIE